MNCRPRSARPVACTSNWSPEAGVPSPERATYPVRIVRRSGGTVTLDGGPLTSTGYRRCRDWQEQWLALPRQVTPAVIGPDGTVHVGADGLRCLAAIMATAGALPGRERVAQAGPALG